MNFDKHYNTILVLSLVFVGGFSIGFIADIAHDNAGCEILQSANSTRTTTTLILDCRRN